MLQDISNKRVTENFNSVEFKGHLLQKIEKPITSRRHMTDMKVAVLDNLDLIAPAARNAKKKTEKYVDV